MKNTIAWPSSAGGAGIRTKLFFIILLSVDFLKKCISVPS